MSSLIKNFIMVVLAMLAGAATVVGFLHFQPSAAPASIVANAEPAPAPISAAFFDEDNLVSIYERVSPAVVNITTSGQLQSPSIQMPELPPEFRGQLPQIPETPSPREVPQGTGSGVIIDAQGHILTNNHVVAGATTINVTLSNGEIVEARLLGRDPGNDLAVLKVDVDPSKLTVAPQGDSSLLRPGQIAIAIGNPFSLERSISMGVISSIGRTFSSGTGSRPIRDMIQTDAAINPGNSGGPLLNSQGEVIGITTAIESPVRGSVGIGFAVPINTAKRYMDDLMAGRTVSHPWLGISGTPVTSTIASQLNIPAEGVYVVDVVSNSPAQKAGLRGAVRSSTDRTSTRVPAGGDVVLAVDGREVKRVEDISSYLDTKRPGDEVTVTIRRDGSTQDVKVILEAWPERGIL
jgi:S1-C subfamily serine protease